MRRGALDAGADSTTIAATVPPRRCFASSYTVPRNAERPLRRDLPESARLHWSADGWETRTDAQTRDTGLGIHTADIPTDGFVPGRDIVFTWMKLATGEWIGSDYSVTIGDG